MSGHLNRRPRAWTWAVTAALLGLVGAGALALPPVPGEPSPDDPMPGDPTPTPGTGSNPKDTNSATPLYPFPDVGGPRQTGEAHAPIGLGALQPALSETDATIQTPYGAVTLSRQYAKGSQGGMTSPFGGRDWTHSLHSTIEVVRRRVAPLNPDTCIGAECTTWTVLEPSGDRLTFLPCTPQKGKACYAGEAHEDGPHPEAQVVERNGNLMERNVQLRWDGERFELLRPGKERLVYELFLQRPRSHPSLPWHGTAVYVLAAIYGPTLAAGTSNGLASLAYFPEGVSPCEGGEMAVDTPALQSVSLAGGSTLKFEWTKAKKLHCPQPPGTPNQTAECTNRPFHCVVSAVRLSDPQGQSEPLVRYAYDTDTWGYLIPGRVAAVGTPREGGEFLTAYLRDEKVKATESTWSELWRVFDDGHERFRQSITNVQSDHQPAFTYEFITQSQSETGNLSVRALRGAEWLTCVARWDYVRNQGCSFSGEYFEPYYWAPGTYAGGQVQEVIDNHVLLGDQVNSGGFGVVTERSFVSGGGKSAYDGGAPAIVTRREVECRAGGVPCPGVQDKSQEWLARSSLNLGTRNERGFWTEYLYTSLEGGPRSPRSEPLVREGRAGLSAKTYNDDGTEGAPPSVPPHREWYDWEWVGETEEARAKYGFEARVARIRQDSVMSPSTSVRTENVPEEAQSIIHVRSAPNSSQVQAIIREGWTKRFSPTGQWSDAKERRFLGTFSYTEYRATGGAPSEYAKGRVVETHGPCWVTSKDAQGCDVETDGLGAPVQVPVARLEYRAPHGYLTAQSTFANCGVQAGAVQCDPSSELRTEFLEYDARGSLLRSVDANGVESESTYAHGRLTREVTRAPGLPELRKTYTYDGRKLLAVRMPSGDYHVSCYRKGATQGCTGGTPSSLLQWRAKALDAHGRDWREKVEYRYEPDSDRVSQERYLERTSGGAVLRRVVALGMDAYGRLTRSQDGEGVTPYVSRASFDANGNMVARGEPYHEAPAFCQDPSKRKDPACAGFTYDGLDRLTSLSFGDGGAAAACFEYDRRGNVSRAKLGCESDCVSCRNGLEIRYEFDDFGRLLSVTEPYKSGPTRYQHDAVGNVVVKATPGSPWLSETRHDAMGRVLSTTAIAPNGRREVLHSFDYDQGLEAEAVADGCPRPSDNPGLKGRLQRRKDSYGYHWFVYDALGRSTAVYRQRYGQSCQEGHSENAPNSFYTYDAAGRVESEVYPHGLVAHYVYGQSGGLGSRVSQIDVSAPGVARRVLIRKVQYQPYGGLKAYELATEGTATSVEWLTGVSNTTGDGCGGRPQEAGATTGDIRALWVSRKPLDGAGSGDVFKQVYSWQGGMRVREDTCLLEQPAHTVCYGEGCTKTGAVRGGYDEKLQIVRAERLASGAQGGPFESRQFGYDARGNRTSEVRDGMRLCYAYQGEQLISVRGAGASGSCSETSPSPADVDYTYDGNGRMVSRGSPTGPKDTFDYDGLIDEAVPTALGSVYRTANVRGHQIESFYDAAGRRWRKEYADGSYREFYWADTELREERADGTGGASGIGVLDSYVWLDGRPVALVRGWENAPLAPSGASCDRDGETVPCGLYFPIVDPLGKAVLLLDGSGRVSGTGAYDAFGHVNRVWHPAGRQGGTVEFSQPPSTDGRVKTLARARVAGAGGILSLRSANGQSLDTSLGSDVIVQRWFEMPADGVVLANLSGDLEASFEGYEYRSHEVGAVPTWVPIRFPGQYHDPEIDLFENWNRYYDPSSGRYHGPEPMLFETGWVLSEVTDGMAIPTYGYAMSNPLMGTDSTGLEFDREGSSKAIMKHVDEACEEKSAVGLQCREMRDRKDMVFVFKEVLPEQDPRIKTSGGAFVMVTKEAVMKSGETRPYEVTAFFHVPTATSSQTAVRAGVIGMSLGQAVRHEAGHVYAFSRLFKEGSVMHRRFSLMWENSLRKVPRVKHD